MHPHRPHKLRQDAHMENTYTIDGYGVDDVFRVGSNSELWPHLNNIDLRYLDSDPYVKANGRIALTMTFNSLPRQLASFRRIAMSGRVVECEPESHILIAGESKGLAAAEIGLYFSDNHEQIDEPLSTDIFYETDIEIRNMLVRKLGKSILKDNLRSQVPQFCEAYRDNVIDALQRESRTPIADAS